VSLFRELHWLYLINLDQCYRILLPMQFFWNVNIDSRTCKTSKCCWQFVKRKWQFLHQLATILGPAFAKGRIKKPFKTRTSEFKLVRVPCLQLHTRSAHLRWGFLRTPDSHFFVSLVSSVCQTYCCQEANKLWRNWNKTINASHCPKFQMQPNAEIRHEIENNSQVVSIHRTDDKRQSWQL